MHSWCTMQILAFVRLPGQRSSMWLGSWCVATPKHVPLTFDFRCPTAWWSWFFSDSFKWYDHWFIGKWCVGLSRNSFTSKARRLFKRFRFTYDWFTRKWQNTNGIQTAKVSSPHFAVPEGRIFLDICSGTTRPLSVAALALGCDVLSFDILLDESMDLLRDDSYEQLLRLCSSGQVGYGSASPACCHYSRLKLRPGPGPKALRTPEALQGVPGLNSADLTKVQESYLMLSRCVTCLTLIFQAGGHVHLEQPPSAMSWLEDCVQQFLKLISAWCIVIAACAYGKDWYKSWMFASSFSELSTLGAVCQHPPNSHLPIRGIDPVSGEFVSRQTACYPEALANMFAKIVDPLLSHNSCDCSWKHRHALLPKKGRYAAPFSYEDGAGIGSFPDWSSPDRSDPDTFQALRGTWVHQILHKKLPKQLLAYFSQMDHPAPPFDDETIEEFRRMLVQFFEHHNVHLAFGLEYPWTSTYAFTGPSSIQWIDAGLW